MRGTDIVTKLSNLDVSRIALCKSPADQDAVFVVVKSEDEVPVETKEETPVAAPVEEVPTAPVAEEVPAPAATQDEPVATTEEPEVAKEESAPVEKSPVPSESRTEEFSAAPADDGMKDCIKGLVDKCNESRAVPKNVLKMIGEVAKYHGIEGPDMEGEDAFVEVTAQLRAVVDILKGLAVVMAKPAPAAPEPPAAPPAAKPKPAPAKKSLDTVRKEALEEVRFQLLKALGKDPYPSEE